MWTENDSNASENTVLIPKEWQLMTVNGRVE
jgi:hypothetical protein